MNNLKRIRESKNITQKNYFFIIYRNVCKMYPQYLKWQKIMIARYLTDKRLKGEK